MLKQRILTAVVLVAGLLAALLLLPPGLLLVLLGGVVLLAAWEWSDLAGLRGLAARAAYVVAILLLLLFAAAYARLLHEAEPLRVRDIVGLAGIWWSLALLWVKGYPGSALLWGSRAARLLIGTLVLVPAWVALAFLRGQEQGVVLILFLIALVASADIGAFFSGRAWGRSKLAPRVSPGKSWAGFWGGLVCAMALALLTWWMLWRGAVAPLPLLLVAAATALASVLGDLLESMIKRHRGVKDSGRCLPGHGGVMDRLDSLSAAAPVFVLGLLLVGWP